MAAPGSEVYRSRNFGDLANRWMHVQRDVPALIDLRRHIENDALEIGRELRGDRCGRGGDHAGCSRRRHAQVRHEELIEADLKHGFLIIECGQPRTRKNLHNPLGLEETEQCREISSLQCQAEHGAGGIRRGEGSRRRDASRGCCDAAVF